MKEINLTRIKIFLFPLLILLIMILSTFPFNYIGIFNFFEIMPLIIFLSGFIVILIGALYDFGASDYLKTTMTGKGKLTDENIRNINKQQLVMTLLFICDGIIYMIVGYIIYII